MALSLLLLGPVPFLRSYTTMPMVWLSMVFFGIGNGCALVPPMKLLKDALPQLGGSAQNMVASSIFNFGINLGGLLGPSLGGALASATGIPWTYAIGSASLLVAATILAADRLFTPQTSQLMQPKLPSRDLKRD
eukprot:gnl/TRDRNA2_/TRDRNA2_208750_c0_seq1.p1 gnl/TRDRNA2_/TRDRNA2_208750_c0~~gnl/TRDRNA2_/TRDRNA2_208750_c0_seq1.p1  ORF type:complete len:150 (-),score=16.76 gnl/TRDRNA2_/TRDRNA2_208750_c0_seq1:59-460(-)